MEQRNFRTYRRRAVTRKSGYHTCEGTTGSECVVVSAQKYRMAGGRAVFVFHRQTVQLTQLFENQCGMLAFGGFIYAPKAAKIAFILSYAHNGVSFTENFAYEGPVNAGNWNGIGFHREIDLAGDDILTDVKVTMTIETDAAELEFVCFDLDAVTKAEYRNAAASTSFYQKTSMHIPYLYYLNSRLPFEQYQNPRPETGKGRLVVLKSCNRCGRFLPINIGNEVNTLAFSLHCKKRAPCVHSAFRAYTICNSYDEEELRRAGIETEQGKVISYYGHQLECKACKKFFVNAPLNPQRNAQQFKEDGLRRRAIEILINYLLGTNLIHFEFERKTKKQFSEYIWKKFGCKCFKCKKTIGLGEMHLDHTMPLAYLYRLDETATCLCGTHNSQKSDRFPADYYTEDELEALSGITGLPMEKLKSRGVNRRVLGLLVENIVWFYDEFLMQEEYQKVRDGILTADKIYDSLQRAIGGEADLAEEYRKRTGKYPSSVTVDRN